jgi:hypothetical protein
MQIEKANILELDWAMANMDSKTSKKKDKKKKDELAFEADIKASKEDVCYISHSLHNTECQMVRITERPSRSRGLLVRRGSGI